MKEHQKEGVMKGARILLVDDETEFTENISKLLNGRGYQATAVNDGESAIEALETDNYDVMVLDLKMPGMDGMTTLREMRKLDLLTETLILTGHGDVGTALEAMKLGAYDYLTKPCEVDALVEKIEGAWEKMDARQKDEMQKRIEKITNGKSF